MAQLELGDGKSVPPFVMLGQEEALSLIDKLPFTDDEKDALRNATSATKRADLYLRYDLRYGVRKSMVLWGELKNWVSTHQIFLHVKVLSASLKIQNELFSILVDAEGYAEDLEVMPLDERIAMKKKLREDFNKAIDDIAETIRSRFGFAEESEA